MTAPNRPADHPTPSFVELFTPKLVTVWREGDPEHHLVVEVTDDGAGGAAPVANGGLSGLADRLAALDGRLFLESPPGGPIPRQQA